MSIDLFFNSLADPLSSYLFHSRPIKREGLTPKTPIVLGDWPQTYAPILQTKLYNLNRVYVGEGEAELADFTPSFLWLLRDFYLTLEEDGRQVGKNPNRP